MMMRKCIVVRGGGDLATGVIHRLYRCGYRVLILECEKPSAIRRWVSFCEAVFDGTSTVEGVTCRKIESLSECEKIWEAGEIPLLVDPSGSCLSLLKEEGCLEALVDAIIAKKNLGTTRELAPLTIALGPGFAAGVDVDFVVETMRGHNLGRIIREGSALPNTGVPGVVGGVSAERVIHAPAAGIMRNISNIGDLVQQGQVLAYIEENPAKRQGSESVTLQQENVQDISSAGKPDAAATTDAHSGQVPVLASITGVLRGIIRDGYVVPKGMKIADIDPRKEQKKNCSTISDKARCIAGSVVEILLSEGVLP